MDPSRTMPAAKQLLALGGFLLLCFAAAAVGGYGSRNAPGFYAILERPTWAPPAWLFGPVWTVLYMLMAGAAWLAWRRVGGHKGRSAWFWFALQLALNAAWPWTFFAWHQGMLSTAVILLLWMAIGLTIKTFWAVDRLAATLLLPYFCWVAYAGALNLALWRANPGLL